MWKICGLYNWETFAPSLKKLRLREAVKEKNRLIWVKSLCLSDSKMSSFKKLIGNKAKSSFLIKKRGLRRNFPLNYFLRLLVCLFVQLGLSWLCTIWFPPLKSGTQARRQARCSRSGCCARCNSGYCSFCIWSLKSRRSLCSNGIGERLLRHFNGSRAILQLCSRLVLRQGL